MKLQSCQNCWFNGLQYGSVGLSVGFCARHRKVLNLPDETTCGLHVRKDLSLARSQEVAAIHARTFADDKIVRIVNNDEIGTDVSASEKDAALVRTDSVGEAVVDYGSLNSRIESLSQLRAMGTARSDLAMTSLGRAYVRNCVRQGGRWTSGLHLLWWTKKRLAVIPDLQISDLRYSGSIQLSRHVELAAWSVMMFRLTLIDDITEYARADGDDIGRVDNILNDAAIAVQQFSVTRLSKWISRELIPSLDSHLNYQRYSSLARELHRNDDSAGQPE